MEMTKHTGCDRAHLVIRHYFVIRHSGCVILIVNLPGLEQEWERPIHIYAS